MTQQKHRGAFKKGRNSFFSCFLFLRMKVWKVVCFSYIQLSIKVLFSKTVLQIGDFPVCYPDGQKKRILRKVENQNDRIITSYNFTSVSLFITFYEKEHFCYFVYQNEQTETKELLKLIDL